MTDLVEAAWEPCVLDRKWDEQTALITLKIGPSSCYLYIPLSVLNRAEISRLSKVSLLRHGHVFRIVVADSEGPTVARLTQHTSGSFFGRGGSFMRRAGYVQGKVKPVVGKGFIEFDASALAASPREDVGANS